MLRALSRFDPDRGVPFPAYAALWIRQALQELRSDFIRPFRLPPKALSQLAQLKSEHDRIYADQQRDASVAELAASTATDRDQVEALLRADAATRSIDEPVAGLEGEIGTLGDLLEDPLSAGHCCICGWLGRTLAGLPAHPRRAQEAGRLGSSASMCVTTTPNGRIEALSFARRGVSATDLRRRPLSRSPPA